MILSRENIEQIPASGDVALPLASCYQLPERVLQFGTGVFLRGLPDYIIDQANRKGIFNGRIIVVKSTGSGATDAFARQQGLYTLCIRGVENGREIRENIINASISRVLSARDEWSKILEYAASETLQVIISNTTEVGITLVKNDRITSQPPVSFPGKLLAFLYERYRVFGGTEKSGMVIIPTELVPDNGTLLKNICIELAALNQLEPAFINWLANANDFCNSLVDRIVPGRLPDKEAAGIRQQNGYTDELMIMSEPYALWAIETDRERTREILSFGQANEGVVITNDISKFRKLKLYLLNSAHTLSCGLALLSGFDTVKEAMANPFFEQFISGLICSEIAGSIIGKEIKEEEVQRFGKMVLDRFRNPFIEHRWQSISMQYTSKMLMRSVPVLQAHYSRTTKVPERIATGFAAYIIFMHSTINEKGQYAGRIHDKEYVIHDDYAAMLHDKWKSGNVKQVVHTILSDEDLWDADLTKLSGFEVAVAGVVRKFIDQDILKLETIQA
ncbi:tagaturonate reductase [Chitinophagaceae bacterium MMS25-I14]